jgi:hypothetical protein
VQSAEDAGAFTASQLFARDDLDSDKRNRTKQKHRDDRCARGESWKKCGCRSARLVLQCERWS